MFVSVVKLFLKYSNLAVEIVCLRYLFEYNAKSRVSTPLFGASLIYLRGSQVCLLLAPASSIFLYRERSKGRAYLSEGRFYDEYALAEGNFGLVHGMLHQNKSFPYTFTLASVTEGYLLYVMQVLWNSALHFGSFLYTLFNYSLIGSSYGAPRLNYITWMLVVLLFLLDVTAVILPMFYDYLVMVQILIQFVTQWCRFGNNSCPA